MLPPAGCHFGPLPLPSDLELPFYTWKEGIRFCCSQVLPMPQGPAWIFMGAEDCFELWVKLFWFTRKKHSSWEHRLSLFLPFLKDLKWAEVGEGMRIWAARVVWRAAEFYGTWVCGTRDVKWAVVGKELQSLRSSCQAFPVLGPLKSQKRRFISFWVGFLFPSQAAFMY